MGAHVNLLSMQNSSEFSVKIQVAWKKLILQCLEKPVVFLD